MVSRGDNHEVAGAAKLSRCMYMTMCLVKNLKRSFLSPKPLFVRDEQESLGLLDSPVPANQSPLVAKVGSTDDKRLALQAAREAITLLKNSMMPTHGNSDEGEDGAAQERSALPLDRTKMSKVLVVGPASHSLRLQSGGWTKHWQVSTEYDGKKTWCCSRCAFKEASYPWSVVLFLDPLSNSR